MEPVLTDDLTSALAATGVVGAGSQSASAICGVQLEIHNIGANDVTVDWMDSSVRQEVMVGGQLIPGPWTSLGNFSTTVAAGGTVNPGFFVPGNCAGVDRQYRLEENQNGVASYVYFPGGSIWTQDRTPHIHVA